METSETCTIQLKTEVDNENRQKWERNVQDDVDKWFTLYNAQTKKYNTAEDNVATTATCKKHLNLHMRRRKITIPVPLNGAACIQKLFFEPSDYHLKIT